jgi:hypothetical protein
LMSALSGARSVHPCRYIFGQVREDDLDKGFISVTMAQDYLHQVPPRTKSSVPNGLGNRLAFERPVKTPVLVVHPEVSASTLSSSKMQFDRKAQDRCSQDNNSRQHM